MGLRRDSWAALVALTCASCAHSDETGHDPSITQGVWGRLVSGCAEPPCEEVVLAGKTVLLTTPSSEPREVLGSGTSDADGFYEIAAPPGHYGVETPSLSVTYTTIPTGLRRCDWTAGTAGGFWACDD